MQLISRVLSWFMTYLGLCLIYLDSDFDFRDLLLSPALGLWLDYSFNMYYSYSWYEGLLPHYIWILFFHILDYRRKPYMSILLTSVLVFWLANERFRTTIYEKSGACIPGAQGSKAIEIFFYLLHLLVYFTFHMHSCTPNKLSLIGICIIVLSFYIHLGYFLISFFNCERMNLLFDL